jgi:hypothetical protein
MTVQITAADAPEPIGPNLDIWEITSLLEVGPTAEGHWITQGRARGSVFLDSDEKALAVAAALVASVEKRRADLAAEGRAA